MADIELKPCPFCGGEAQMFDLRKVHLGVFYFVECRERKCRVKTGYLCTKEEAAEVWNRRAETKGGENGA